MPENNLAVGAYSASLDPLAGREEAGSIPVEEPHPPLAAFQASDFLPRHYLNVETAPS